MKRTILAVTSLALATGVAWADYLVIRINLKGSAEVAAAAKPEDSGGSGGGSTMTMGRGGSLRGGGTRGGSPPPPGGGSGTIGGGGAIGGGTIGGGGSIGGSGNIGGMTGGGGNQPNTPSGSEQAPRPDWFLVAVDVNVTAQQSKPLLQHRWGATPLKPDESIDQIFYFQHIKFPSVAAQLDSIMREKRKSEPFEVLEWMLQHWNLPVSERGGFDMQAKFEAFLEELARESTKFAGPERERLERLLKVRDQLKNPLKSGDQVVAMLKKLPAIGEQYRVLSKPHYLLLYTSRRDKMAERVIFRLEQVFAGYYYNMALLGDPLPFPETQLVAVLAETEEKFNQLHKVFDSIPLRTDGFYAPIESVIILSAERRDEPFKKLLSHVADIEKELKKYDLTLNKLLRNEPIPKSASEKAGGLVTYGRALALALEAAREEGEVATLTREAILQVAFASGRLPAKLHLPEFLAAGFANFFCTPRSSMALNLPALWSGMGGSHWTLLPVYRRVSEAEKAGGKLVWPEVLHQPITLDKSSILSIVTDQLYRDAEQASEDQRAFLQARADAESWALVYFMLRKRPEQFRRFCEELATLPRGMDLTPEMVTHAFGRAFNLIDDPEKGEIVAGKLDDLEKEFRGFMSYQVLPVETADKGQSK